MSLDMSSDKLPNVNGSIEKHVHILGTHVAPRASQWNRSHSAICRWTYRATCVLVWKHYNVLELDSWFFPVHNPQAVFIVAAKHRFHATSAKNGDALTQRSNTKICNVQQHRRFWYRVYNMAPLPVNLIGKHLVVMTA